MTGGLRRGMPRGVPWVCGALATCGCGGGMPLLHPAQVLAPGEVRAAAGFTGHFLLGGLSDALGAARVEAGAGPAPGARAPTDTTYVKGALVAAAATPGLAPFASARAGIGRQWEGGLTYTGRAARLDVRRAFDVGDRWTVSLGGAGGATLYGHGQGGELPDVDLGQLHGWSAEVPVLAGYESEAGLYAVWVGARGGFEHVAIGEVRSEPKAVTLGAPPVGLTADRTWGGAVVGLAVGLHHVHVAMELDAAYAYLAGTYNETHAAASGLSLAPAAALWWHF